MRSALSSSFATAKRSLLIATAAEASHIPTKNVWVEVRVGAWESGAGAAFKATQTDARIARTHRLAGFHGMPWDSVFRPRINRSYAKIALASTGLRTYI